MCNYKRVNGRYTEERVVRCDWVYHTSLCPVRSCCSLLCCSGSHRVHFSDVYRSWMASFLQPLLTIPETHTHTHPLRMYWLQLVLFSNTTTWWLDALLNSFNQPTFTGLCITLNFVCHLFTKLKQGHCSGTPLCQQPLQLHHIIS